MTCDKYCAHKVQKQMEEIIAALTFEQAVLESAVESPEDEEKQHNGESATEVFSDEHGGLFDPDEELIEVDVEEEREKAERRRTMWTADLSLPGTKRHRDM